MTAEPESDLPDLDLTRDTAPVKVSLRAQADCAHRELVMRHRVYPGRVRKGYMTPAEQAREIDEMRAVRDTLRLFAEHEDAIRETLQREIAAQKLRDHPSVAAVHDAFPGVTVAAVRPLYDFTGDTP